MDTGTRTWQRRKVTLILASSDNGARVATDAVADEDAERAVTVDCANAVDARAGWVTVSWSSARCCFCDGLEVYSSLLAGYRLGGEDDADSAWDSYTRTVYAGEPLTARLDTA